MIDETCSSFIDNWIVSMREMLLQLPEGAKIYFLRHGQTDLNAQGIVQGGSMWKQQLNQTGVDQLKGTRAELCTIKFDKVFTSPALRAIHSAGIVSHYCQPKTIDSLNEVYWGNIDGREQGIVYHAIQRSWFEDYRIHEFLEGGESIFVFMNRILVAMSEITRESSSCKVKNILVAGHGFWIGLFLSTLINGRMSLELKPKNGKYLILKISEDINIVTS